MKRFFLSIIALFLLSVPAHAGPVDADKAKQVGQSFFSSLPGLRSGGGAVELQLVYTDGMRPSSPAKSVNLRSDTEDTPLLYIFNVRSGGFVMVSGDDQVIPVLGYSNMRSFNPDSLPPNARKWLEACKLQILDVIAQDIPSTPEIREAWDGWLNGVPPVSLRDASSVAPLIKTEWGQELYYNDLCPKGLKSTALTGCVATAMAQVMKYWNHPVSGSGFHSYRHGTYGTLSANFGDETYQWNAMPNKVASANNAVATLMYHCGVSVDMDYGTISQGGSGAYVISSRSPVTHCTEYALKTYFNYENMLSGRVKDNYGETQWINLLKTELDAGRPIIYAGFGSGGHCFVCDGYDNRDYFHFNWGWNGSFDGYFSVNALNPGGESFTDDQQALVGIMPSSASPGESTFDLALYQSLTASATTLNVNEAFSLHTDIANFGTETFNGDFCAAVFDSQGQFLDYVETKNNCSLPGGAHYRDGLTFSTDGIGYMYPGTYRTTVYYRPSGGNWVQIPSGEYYNLIELTVVYPNDIELRTAMTITPDPLIQGAPASVSLNVVNRGNANFVGAYGVGLVGTGENDAQIIGLYNESQGLPPGYTYRQPLTFSTGSIDVPPGTYTLAAFSCPQGIADEMAFLSSNNYPSLIKVIVQEPPIPVDKYESNNTAETAYPLPVTFTNDRATVHTDNATLHLGTDVDVYKITLPAGHNYTLTARLHDAYNSGNGQTYTVDALFVYSTDGGSTWKGSYDDIMPGSLSLRNGGVVHFRVTSYYTGGTGDYLLDLGITRTSGSGGGDLAADRYEENNTAATAYTLPVSFTNNTAALQTTGSNFHSATDEDYYQITLPAGYDYTVKSAIKDSFDDNSLTGAGKFYCSVNNGITWSDVHYVSETLSLTNGGSVFFRMVQLLSEGKSMGTYLLTLDISRTKSNGTSVENVTEQITVYPNPVQDVLFVDLNTSRQLTAARLYNSQGQIVAQPPVHLVEQRIEIPVHHLPNGFYFLRLEFAQETITRKIIVRH
jgi:hypothetical protein